MSFETLVNSFSAFISKVDFFLSDPQFRTQEDDYDCTPPTGRLRTAVLKLRDEADYLRATLTRGNNLPQRDVCMAQIKLLRETLYRDRAQRGTFFQPGHGPTTDKEKKNLAGLVFELRKIGLMEIFEYLAADIEEFLSLEGYQDWTHRGEALKLLDKAVHMNLVCTDLTSEALIDDDEEPLTLAQITKARLAGKTVSQLVVIS
jgi:hypothetical protein